ncbi:MAG: hypothetical protein ABR955_14455 [Verrucomicrobiota bacterium]|jgi:hypothetical protein
MNLQIMKTIFGLPCGVLIAGCVTQNPPQRYSWVMNLKSDMAARCEDLHAKTKEVYLLK